MQATPIPVQSDAAAPAASHSRGRRRLAGLFTLLLILVSIAVLPPLVNVSRFQKRIARNISAALGRPVYFDHVTLVLFPQPGFTLDNVVIDEDPAFGYEPILRADQVQVTLRLSSLFRAHTEFSKIAFSAPSVNLVYTGGRWNVENLLLQAAHAQAAPTAQRFAGPARRFPYIEATGARLNLKLDQEKLPVALTDADFALWLPEPHQWHLRLEAHPIRTDAEPGDTGTIRAEGTLGGGVSPGAAGENNSLADTPIDLHGDWRAAQLGGISRLLMGSDPGLRGDFAFAFGVRGTVARNTISADIQLANARREAFVPDHPLSLEASCEATSTDTFRAFPTIECRWPPASSSSPPLAALTGSLPDARNVHSASATLSLPSIAADTLAGWLSIATPHPPALLADAGNLTGSLTWGASGPALTGEIHFTGGSLLLDAGANRTLALGDVVLASGGAPAPLSRHPHPAPPAPAPDSFTLQPLALDLGGRQPATFTAHFDAIGYTLHLTGMALPATLREMAKAVPQFGENLGPLVDELSGQLSDDPLKAVSTTPETPAAAIPIDLTATRAWGAAQTWTDNSAHR